MLGCLWKIRGDFIEVKIYKKSRLPSEAGSNDRASVCVYEWGFEMSLGHRKEKTTDME